MSVTVRPALVLTRRRRVALVAALVVVAAVVCVLAATGLRHLIDLGVYLWGGDQVRAGESPYDGREPVANLPFTYPPAAAYGFLPLAALPVPLAVVLWLGLVVASGAAAVAVLLRGALGRTPDWLLVTGVTAAAFVTEPFAATFGYGQVNTVLLAMVVVDVVLVRRGVRGAGVLTGVAVAVKLTPAVFVAYWLLTGRRRAALTAGATFAVVSVLPVLSGRPWTWGYWTEGVSDPSRLGYVRGAGNQSLLGMVSRSAVGAADSTALRWALLLGAVAVGLALARRLWRQGRDDLGFAVVAVAALLAAPASWDHHYVWLLPLLVLLLAPRPRPVPPTWRVAGVVTVLVLLVCPPRRVEFDARLGEPPGVLETVPLAAYTLLAIGLLVLVWLESRRDERPPAPSSERGDGRLATAGAVTLRRRAGRRSG